MAGRPGGGLRAQSPLRVPGDKSISHRALLLAAQAGGVSRIAGLSDGDDVYRTLEAIRALGARVSDDPTGALRVEGGPLHRPLAPIFAGNSGTTMRLLAGFCAPLPWRTVIVGDESLSRRPMDRVVGPLRAMGARIEGGDGGRLPPLEILGGALRGIDYEMPMASAQVKAAILLAGLHAEGETVVRERIRTRAHTEELLARCGADVTVEDDGHTVRLKPSPLRPFALEVPGDPSQAAFWVVAACLVPNSELDVGPVYVGPARTGFIEVLRRMGAHVEVDGGHIRARVSSLRATTIAGDEVPGLIDELPVLAVAGALAEGTTEIRNASELRVKESDRIATMADGLRRLGADVETRGDGLVVRGPTRLVGATVDAHGDHRVAMALAVAGLAAEGETTVEGWDAVSISYPTFEEDLHLCLS